MEGCETFDTWLNWDRIDDEFTLSQDDAIIPSDVSFDYFMASPKTFQGAGFDKVGIFQEACNASAVNDINQCSDIRTHEFDGIMSNFHNDLMVNDVPQSQNDRSDELFGPTSMYSSCQPDEDAASIRISGTRKQKKANRFESAQIRRLKQWLDVHARFPYPDRNALRLLCKDTHLTTKQIRDWFSRARQKKFQCNFSDADLNVSLVAEAAGSPRSIGRISDWSDTMPISDHLPLTSDNLANISQKTVQIHNWLVNLVEEQVESLTSVSPRPNSCPPETFSEDLTMQRLASPIDEDTSPFGSSKWKASSKTADDTNQLVKMPFSPAPLIQQDTYFDGGPFASSVAASIAGSFSSTNSARSFMSMRSSTSKASRKGRRLVSPDLCHASGMESPYRPRPFHSKSDGTMRYSCTFCRHNFGSKFAWQRHEESVHVLNKKWICRDRYSWCDSPTSYYCPRCQGCFKTASCIHHESLMRCWTLPELERTFYRRDAFKEHQRRVHMMSFPLDISRYETDTPISSQSLFCGFCGETFLTWRERFSHVSQHFEDGAHIEEWKFNDEMQEILKHAETISPKKSPLDQLFEQYSEWSPPESSAL